MPVTVSFRYFIPYSQSYLELKGYGDLASTTCSRDYLSSLWSPAIFRNCGSDVFIIGAGGVVVDISSCFWFWCWSLGCGCSGCGWTFVNQSKSLPVRSHGGTDSSRRISSTTVVAGDTRSEWHIVWPPWNGMVGLLLTTSDVFYRSFFVMAHSLLLCCISYYKDIVCSRSSVIGWFWDHWCRTGSCCWIGKMWESWRRVASWSRIHLKNSELCVPMCSVRVLLGSAYCSISTHQKRGALVRLSCKNYLLSAKRRSHAWSHRKGQQVDQIPKLYIK